MPYSATEKRRAALSSDPKERFDSPVSFLFLPRTMMVSPLKSCRVSIVAGLSEATELSSDDDSSTMRRLGLVGSSARRVQQGQLGCDRLGRDWIAHLFLGRRMAVAASSSTLGREGSADMAELSWVWRSVYYRNRL